MSDQNDIELFMLTTNEINERSNGKGKRNLNI